MRPLARCPAELLNLLSEMPFLDRLEMVSISGWSRGAVYPAVERLEGEGLVGFLPHASDLLPPTRRYYLTLAGLEDLARRTGTNVDSLLHSQPVSSQWRRVLMERLDALAVIYRVSSAISNVEHPIRFRWFRAMPMDAVITLPDGRTIAVVRQGKTSDRTAFSKRAWRLTQRTRPSAVLVIVPDEVRLRYSRRALSWSQSMVLMALEREAAGPNPGSPIWRTTSNSTSFGLRDALSIAGSESAPVEEEPIRRADPPEELQIQMNQVNPPGWLLPATLKPAEKGALELISDWPWITFPHLGALMGVRRSMLARILSHLLKLQLVISLAADGARRLILTDRGLALLARRDRASVGAARRRWSADLQDSDLGLSWRNVSGRRSRQLLRNEEHTGAVHWFLAILANQVPARGWKILQLDPPRHASRYFRHDDKVRSINPDAFGILKKGDETEPFFLEWERRAIRPVTMTDRIAPYLRYYSTQRPTDDNGARPSVFVVFEDEIPQIHFLRVAREAMDMAGVKVPLLVSHRGILERVGPLGPAWLDVDSWEPGEAFKRH